MKNTIFGRLALAPLALLLAGGAALSAQAARPSFGAALSLVNPMGDLAKDPASAGLGFTLGAFYELPLTALPLSVRATLEYAMFGGKEPIPGTEVSLSHFGVVADALYYFDAKRSFSVLAGVGFYSRPMTVKVGGVEKTEDLDDSIGVNLGAGYWFTKNLGAEFRYILPFGADAPEGGGDKPDTSWIQVSFKCRF